MNGHQGEKAWTFQEVMDLEAQSLEHKRISSWPYRVFSRKTQPWRLRDLCELVLIEYQLWKSAPKLWKFPHTPYKQSAVEIYNRWKGERAAGFQDIVVQRSWSGILNCDVVMISPKFNRHLILNCKFFWTMKWIIFKHCLYPTRSCFLLLSNLSETWSRRLHISLTPGSWQCNTLSRDC